MPMHAVLARREVVDLHLSLRDLDVTQVQHHRQPESRARQRLAVGAVTGMYADRLGQHLVANGTARTASG